MTDFIAVAARARGLRRQLLTRAELEALAAHDAASLPRALNRSGKLRAPLIDNASVPEIDGALRQTVKRHLGTLARWDGAAPLVEVFAADQDRRSLRALIRGAQQAASADLRLAGLLATPSLPERALTGLARQPTPAAVAAQLFVLRHPDAGALTTLTARKAQPDLFAVELALLHGFAARGAQGARRGDQNLRRFVAHRLDVSNAQAALLLVGAREVEPARCFVEGGACLEKDAFLAAARAETPREAMLQLRQGLARSPLARLVAPGDEGPVDALRLERAGAALLLDEQQKAAREDPLGSGPALAFLLRLEVMARDVRRIAWAAALGAPASVVKPDLVTPWP
ncbi:MAG: V-type ATPase subunit [Myxococcaceae bacterium]